MKTRLSYLKPPHKRACTTRTRLARKTSMPTMYIIVGKHPQWFSNFTLSLLSCIMCGTPWAQKESSLRVGVRALEFGVWQYKQFSSISYSYLSFSQNQEKFWCCPKMKLIQRRAYGYRNFENYHLHVLIEWGSFNLWNSLPNSSSHRFWCWPNLSCILPAH